MKYFLLSLCIVFFTFDFLQAQTASGKKDNVIFSPLIQAAKTAQGSIKQPVVNGKSGPGLNAVQTSPYHSFSSSANVFTSAEASVTFALPNCLTYNKDLNTVMFTHRKSPVWILNGGYNNTGAVQASWSQDNGQTWDSVMVYADTLYVARNPSGILYNPSSNTSITNAKAVSGGIGMQLNVGFKGTYFGSDNLINDVGNELANTDRQFISGSGGAFDSIYHVYNDMQQVGDNVFVLGGIMGDANSGGQTLTPAYDFHYKGLAIVKGVPNGNGFDWSATKLYAPCLSTNNYPRIYCSPIVHLAFSPDGQTGYVVMTGVEDTATGSRRSIQPIVYKSTDSGNNWQRVNAGYDWSAGNNVALMNTLHPTEYGNQITMPYFLTFGGSGVTVDMYGRLHFSCVVTSAYSAHVDSLDYIRAFRGTNFRPNLWDFVTDGNGQWQEVFINAMNTDLFYNEADSPDPWFISGIGVQPYGHRTQMSRNATGSSVFVGWIDSDTSLTHSIYNVMPDIHMVGIDAVSLTRSPVKNVTPGLGNAFWMFMSNIVAEPAPGQYQIPFTYSTNDSYNMDAKVYHYYVDDAVMTDGEIQGVDSPDEIHMAVSQNVPNPFSDVTKVRIDTKIQEAKTLTITDLMGQVISEKNIPSSENVISIDGSALKPGIYFYTITANGNSVTKKMIVQR